MNVYNILVNDINTMRFLTHLHMIYANLIQCHDTPNYFLFNLNIGTYRSGREVGGKPEWNVVVTNNCNCARNQSLELPRIVKFSYAWDPPVLKLPKSFSGDC